ncbi:TetR/AcrR family transcriptional regulator [Deinococcus ruber]|uniref:TetR family transcriptional regulator n=1 Tax=Deinococcus ruber TaxID=1848197 RepID=A0A918CGB5_9DEIO|nr:TetR/AcrR family transcriptional regulator [Deinococcus ruber]GGR22257.1 TetR family transcriptional regulator [Deinococcus ruber]
MPRVSRTQAAQNRELTIQAAARLFRERGIDHVSVQDVMAAVGLTHGGFYRQFKSKDALVSEATRYAYTSMAASIGEVESSIGDHHAAQQAYIREYLSAAHRDHPGQGCPTAALVQDVARTGTADTRHTLAEGVESLARWLDSGDQDGLVTACTLFGALLVARAAEGTPLADQVLERVGAALTQAR